MYSTFHNPVAALSTTKTRILHRIIDLEAAKRVAGLKGERDEVAQDRGTTR